MQQLLQAVEITRCRLRDADIHHHGLDDQARDLVAALVEQVIEDVEIVERDDMGVPAEILRDPE